MYKNLMPATEDVWGYMLWNYKFLTSLLISSLNLWVIQGPPIWDYYIIEEKKK